MVIELDEHNRKTLIQARHLIDTYLKENILFIDGVTVIPIQFAYELVNDIGRYCEEHNITAPEFVYGAIYDKLKRE